MAEKLHRRHRWIWLLVLGALFLAGDGVHSCTAAGTAAVMAR